MISSNTGGTSGGNGAPNYLNPNNTTYTNAFVFATMFRVSSGFYSEYETHSAFRLPSWLINTTFYITNFTQYKNIRGFADIYGVGFAFPVVAVFSVDWRDTITPWTSLGTIIFAQATSGYILVRRLV